MEPIRTSTYADGRAEVGVVYAYQVKAIDRRGAEGEPAGPVTGTARLVKEAVFVAPLADTVNATVNGSEALAGKGHGGAKVAAGVLDLSRGGHVTYPHREQFDLSQPLSVELWVWLDQAGQMPVVVSCGVWQQAGWFLQRIGGGWRWHVGGVNCDGGRPASGKWLHMVCMYDGQVARLYENGVKVAEKSAAANTQPWGGELYVGQYSGQPGPEYQTHGKIARLKIYHRALSKEEIEKVPPVPSPAE